MKACCHQKQPKKWLPPLSKVVAPYKKCFKKEAPDRLKITVVLGNIESNGVRPCEHQYVQCRFTPSVFRAFRNRSDHPGKPPPLQNDAPCPQMLPLEIVEQCVKLFSNSQETNNGPSLYMFSIASLNILRTTLRLSLRVLVMSPLSRRFFSGCR